MESQQGLGDIIANTVTHGLGAVLAIAGAVLLLWKSSSGTVTLIASCAVFSITLVLVYVCSTLYHSLIRTRARHVLMILDHSAIYLLIAGTYTPFTLVSLHGRTGWILFAAVWTIALLGVIFKAFAVERFHVFSAIAYVAMGWLVDFRYRPVNPRRHLAGRGMAAGGRTLLHRRRLLLRHGQEDFLPRHMARLRAGGQCIPLLRGLVLCAPAHRLTPRNWEVNHPKLRRSKFRDYAKNVCQLSRNTIYPVVTETTLEYRQVKEPWDV